MTTYNTQMGLQDNGGSYLVLRTVSNLVAGDIINLTVYTSLGGGTWHNTGQDKFGSPVTGAGGDVWSYTVTSSDISLVSRETAFFARDNNGDSTNYRGKVRLEFTQPTPVSTNYYYYIEFGLFTNPAYWDFTTSSNSSEKVDKHYTSHFPRWEVDDTQQYRVYHQLRRKNLQAGTKMPGESIGWGLTTNDPTSFNRPGGAVPGRPYEELWFPETTNTIQHASALGSFYILGGNRSTSFLTNRFWRLYKGGANYYKAGSSSGTSFNDKSILGMFTLFSLAPPVLSTPAQVTFDSDPTVTVQANLSSNGGGPFGTVLQYENNSSNEEPQTLGGILWGSSNQFTHSRGVTMWYAARVVYKTGTIPTSFTGNSVSKYIGYKPTDTTISNIQNIIINAADNSHIRTISNGSSHTTYIVRKSGTATSLGSRLGSGNIVVDSSNVSPGTTDTNEIWATVLQSNGGDPNSGYVYTGVSYQVTKSAIAPTIDLAVSNKYIVDPGEGFLLDSQASDADGTISSLVWTQTGGTSIFVGSNTTGIGTSTATNNIGLTAPFGDTTLQFTITATDNDGQTASSSVAVDVGSGGSVGTDPTSGTYGLEVRNSSGRTIVDLGSRLIRTVTTGSLSLGSGGSSSISVPGMVNSSDWTVFVTSDFPSGGTTSAFTVSKYSGGFTLTNNFNTTISFTYWIFRTG